MPVLFGRRTSLALLTALCLSPACRPKEPVAPDDAAVEAAGQAAVAAAPVSAVARPSQMLPPGTGVLVVGRSPARAAEVLGRDRLVETFGADYEAVRQTFAPALGFDPFDPAGYAAVGLDPEGPFGFALLDPDEPVVALFATVADAGKVKGTARDVAGRDGKELGERDYGGAAVLRAQNDPNAPALVVRGSLAVLVLPMRGAPEQDWAERLATLAPEDSLSRARGYRRAMGAYADGDVLAFVDPALLVEQAFMKRAAATEPTPSTETAVRAPGSDASPEETAERERAKKEQAAAENGWARRDQASRDLLALTVSGIEGLGVRLTAKTSGVFVEGRAALSADAFLRRTFHNVPGRALLPQAMGGEPLFLLSGGVDPQPAQQWLDLAMQADGTSWAEVAAKLKDEAEVDLDREIVPQLAGDAGLMFTLDEPIDFGHPKLPEILGFAAHARVKDPAAAKALLQKVDASTGKLGAMLTADGDRFVADVPGYREVWVEIAGDQLLVSTDKQLGVRVARNTRGMMGRNTDPPEAWAAMMMPDRAAVLALDARFFAMTFMGMGDIGMELLESPDLADVPMSRKAKAKQKEIDAVDEKLNKARDQEMGEQLARLDGLASPIGVTVITAALDDRGVDVLGAQLVRAKSLGAMIEGVARAIVSGRSSAVPTSDEVSRLLGQRAKLQEELRTIREADAARIRGRKPRGPKKSAAPAKGDEPTTSAAPATAAKPKAAPAAQ